MLGPDWVPMLEQKERRKDPKQCYNPKHWVIFSIRTWKNDPFLQKLYFSYPKRTAQLWKSTLSHHSFVQVSVPSWVASALGPQFEAFYLRTSKQAYWKPGDVRDRNPYVCNKRTRRADTSAFAPSDFYTSMCVYPYAFIHICVINIQNIALSTSHEGNALCVYHPSALKIATLRDWKSRIRMRKRTRICAYGSVPYTFLNLYFCVVYAFGVKTQVLK